MAKEKISGSEALIRSLLAENVKTIYGYPGGAIMPVFDCLYDYKDRIRHILVRHEQGATHAAQGHARVSGEVGVVLVTSGPAATNIITGVTDAMIDSTPLVVITGQVSSSLLGTDAFQETDVVGITQPVTKWSYQIRHADDIAGAVARAFYIARTGRPGPVVLDLAKDAQQGMTEFEYKECNYIRSYIPYPEINDEEIKKAAELINAAQKPFLLLGQGVVLSHAEQELMEMVEKADIPVGCTLLGLSAMPTDHPLNKGMLGMHGNVGPNIKTNECDVLIAVGMRFDDRVTGDLNTYARQAKVIHFDIDASEFDKNVKTEVSVLGDAKATLSSLIPLLEKKKHTAWIESFTVCEEKEYDKVISKELFPADGPIQMGEVVRKVSEATANKAILVTDVGQNQMFGARYFKFTQTRSIVTSGGLGTMGFGLPAAIGAKIGAPERTVCLFVGDGGLQMTIEELGVIMQYGVDVKIILLNNNFLGMVRQWQQLFFHERYSETPMLNPDFVALAASYGIKGRDVERREQLDDAIAEMLSHKGAYLLNVAVEEKGMVFPMTPAGSCVTNIMLNVNEKY
ncbi:biosynthetic-type acetolactate synthase large subunit [Gabonia massiliensis]|uniref:biosynthetic-type acetolactate synthase large subunit n=1 Tax=Gabonia massiliensis TaxID=1686296 RepID=UPI00033C5000|nr:biosynthetic-type acetolactate synthase large subunit [Gabonia massiliensis]CCY36815.1 acetolactate synthase large subunit biosynthetic type [Tannerella sp. CAG:118]